MCDQRNGDDDDVNELSASDDSEPEELPSGAPFDPELDQDEDDDGLGGVGESEVSAPSSQTSFSLRGGSSAFSDRSHSIFDCLDNVSKLSSSSQNQEHTTHVEFVRPQPPPPSRKSSQPPPTSPTPPKKRGVPDYLVHPERWTHYSLEDVTESSDKDNHRAAYQFLSSLQQEKQSNSEQSNIQQRMIFSRPKRPLKEQAEDDLSALTGKEKGMHLSHLEEEEKEEGGERGKVGDRGTDRSKDENEEKDETRAVGQSEKEIEKQAQREKDEEEDKMEQVNPGFISFRKTKSKNYRKSLKQEDN
ncbi:hypothetical protein Q5P01_006091 [Channa striata]|uniref:U5 small nuclear ribonucleoprotein TSSC4 n=1 Tax=Channa striata TaxID=64152 RepID=A0AA88T435_CHASR|nr:hypothetical protein Q5P01_006091 [Channa striata]